MSDQNIYKLATLLSVTGKYQDTAKSGKTFTTPVIVIITVWGIYVCV